MEDILTEIPPPSRFFQEDLNNFAPRPLPLPSPFILFSNLKPNLPLRPSLLIIALSDPSLFIFHHVSAKIQIGSLFLPEIPFSGNTIKPSLGDKSSNIYSLSGADNLNLLVSVQYPVTAERANVVAKLLIGEQIIPERVLILDSLQSQNFRSKLSPDETYAFKLETDAERKGLGGRRAVPLLKSLEYYPSGSMVDGLGAALLTQCQMRNIKATLCVSWPQYGGSVLALLRSLLQKNVLHSIDLSSGGETEDTYSRFNRIKDHTFDSDLYT